MTKIVPLSTGPGEIIAPQTLMIPFLLSPDGSICADPGALHGRSQVESSVQLVRERSQVVNPQVYWLIWVAVELDGTNQPIRYKGLAASELWIDLDRKVGYKVLAEHVNRMSEAMRGGVNLKTLDATAKSKITQQLISLDSQVWERTAPSLKEALK